MPVDVLILASLAVLLLQFAEIVRGAPTGTTTARWSTHSYRWRSRTMGCEHTISYVTAGCGEPVVLCHGFGGSAGYWRETIPPLAAAGHKVYALDLLGFGGSDKPTDVTYSVDLWSELLLDFHDEFVQRPAVFMGNSLGSLVALSAAAADASSARDPRIAGLVVLNCAGGMNSKFVVSDPANPGLVRAVLGVVFGLIDWVLNNPPLRDRAFAAYANEDNVRSILQAVYVNRGKVDEELVRTILAPASDPNAARVFSAIITGDPGLPPDALVDGIQLPVLAVWGEQDTFTPLLGSTGRLFSRMAVERPETFAMRIIEAGHVPHDDNPSAVLDELLPFLQMHLSKRRVAQTSPP
ncbi:Alpha/Beta hydrolase protein [Pavlovales sp. CCMP2436]|nr:Alpha/Beta hydrolase protein [Pavlovales sp. CCMP2436]|mmetsp:Transcript_5135/g.13363  ORF Transcript_5135/g.13363 Transcript_5135/m.13363 type:complete len:352 (-) Transcript_5135:98-1153(-)